MSRGHGKIERAILEALQVKSVHVSGSYRRRGRMRDTETLVSLAYGVTEPTESQRRSVRRAMRKLETEGLIAVERDHYFGLLAEPMPRTRVEARSCWLPASRALLNP